MAQKEKPNFKKFNNKTSGPQEPKQNEQRDSKKIEHSRDHHDTRVGGGGNNTGNKNK